MLKKSLRNAQAPFRLPVQIPGKPETAVSTFLEGLRPLGGFQGNPVGSREAGGYKTDVLAHDAS
jgi:hypothetical protein